MVLVFIGSNISKNSSTAQVVVPEGGATGVLFAVFSLVISYFGGAEQGTLGVVLTISGPSAINDTGVKSLTTS